MKISVMALSTKIIRRRIRSVRNTKKITKAMELVSASKMRRSVQAVLLSRSYAHTAYGAVLNISKRISGAMHPLLASKNSAKKACYILISSNRGLCGGFNSQVIARGMKYAEAKKGIQNEWIILGKKGGEALARNKKNISAEFVKPDVVGTVSDITAIAKMATKGFLQGIYDEVYIIYTDFVSALKQEPRIKKFLPFSLQQDENLGSIQEQKEKLKTEALEVLYHEEYSFEPGPEIVLDFFLKRLIEVQIYQALLESTASEHAARMLAMRQASDAATDMIDDLTLMYNQARQASITREIAEISGGKAALGKI